MLELGQRLQVRRVVLLGAYLADVFYSRPVGITGFGSEGALLDRQVEPTGYEGPTGIVGVLGSRLWKRGFETASLWAGLPHYIGVSPNPRGTLALVERTGPLLDRRSTRSRCAAPPSSRRISQLVASDPALSEYVRELKKREFAQ